MGTKQAEDNNPLGLLRLSEVVKVLRIDRRTVLKLIHNGSLKGLRVSNLWFVERAELQAYIEMLRQRYETDD